MKKSEKILDWILIPIVIIPYTLLIFLTVFLLLITGLELVTGINILENYIHPFFQGLL